MTLSQKVEVAALVTMVTFFGQPAHTAPTAKFKVSGFKDLDKGQPKGTLVSTESEVLAGRGTIQVKGFDAAMIWSRARDSDGTVYFGTGDNGKLLAVKDNKVRVVADLKAVLVTALAIGPKGKILAGIMPEARILEVEPKSGKWQQLAKLPTEHVWALLYDSQKQTIYAASGAPGKLFSIPEKGGKPNVLYDPSENHLLCLTKDKNGDLLTGSSDKAILYRVSTGGKGAAIHDFDTTELRDIVVGHNGTIYVATNKFPRKTAGLPRYDPTKDGESGTSLKKELEKGKKPKVRPNELRPGAKIGKGALFKISKNGRVDEILNLDDGYFTDLEVDPQGIVWAAEGTQGKIYLVQNNRTVFAAYDFPERQVLALAVAGEQQYLATGDAGAIYRVLPKIKQAPEYLSQAFDAKFHSSWGALVLQTTGKLEVASRSGNTAKPDLTWSLWKSAHTQRMGRFQLKSAPARYLQLKFVWRNPYDAVLRSFVVYYRPQNQRARITKIGPDDTNNEKKKNETKINSSKIKITWKVENPDEDSLVYRLFFREGISETWRPLTKYDAPLEKTEYEWDTESAADGYYQIKVEVSDERDNGPENTLKGSRISDPILVDNRKPKIVGLNVRYPWVTGLARDSFSEIQSIEYSLDGRLWRLISPQDGIYDNPSETFRFKLPQMYQKGPHTLAIRTRDSAGNIGVVHAPVRD
ncbi:MAG: hypothetical protein V1754_08295 [Pseudomonadota bacterium]